MTGRGQMLHEIGCQDVSGRPLIYSQSGKRVGVMFDWLGADDSGTIGGRGADLLGANWANWANRLAVVNYSNVCCR